MPTNLFDHINDRSLRGYRECSDQHFEPTAEAEPTTAPQGSRRKIALMAARVEAGVELWNPDDRSCFDD